MLRKPVKRTACTGCRRADKGPECASATQVVCVLHGSLATVQGILGHEDRQKATNTEWKAKSAGTRKDKACNIQPANFS